MKRLEDDLRLRWCDPHFYKLIKILMIADSSTYNFMHPKQWVKQREEFCDNSKMMIKDWNKYHEERKRKRSK